MSKANKITTCLVAIFIISIAFLNILYTDNNGGMTFEIQGGLTGTLRLWNRDFASIKKTIQETQNHIIRMGESIFETRKQNFISKRHDRGVSYGQRERIHTPLPQYLMDELYINCDTYKVPVSLALGVIEQESGFDVDAIGPDGKDIGLFQIRKSNHEWLQLETGADPMQPIGNIECGIWLLSYLIARYDTTDAALTAYRWGHDTGDRQYANQVLACAEAYK